MPQPLLLGHTDCGAGPAVVLLHSTAADSGMWAAQLPVLSRRCRVIAPDLRGFGLTPLPPEPYAHAADVLTLVDALGIDDFDLVGSSGGGHVALQIASARPERVRRLSLLCAAADGVEPTPALRTLWTTERALIDAGDLDAAAQLNAETWLGPDADPEAHEAVFAMQRRAFQVQLAAGDVEELEWPVELTRITAPVTVVTGAHDLDFFGLVGAHLAAALPDAEAVELAWAGHLPSLERPDEIAELLSQRVGG